MGSSINVLLHTGQTLLLSETYFLVLTPIQSLLSPAYLYDTTSNVNLTLTYTYQITKVNRIYSKGNP